MKQRQLMRRAIPGVLGFVLLLGGLAAPANAAPAPSAGEVAAPITDTAGLLATGDVDARQTPYTYVNRATGRCLDSNYAGDVYTLPCNDGTYQVWASSNGTDIVNRQTFLCLDSNFAGDVYTLGCNGGDYQKWSARL